MIQFVIKGESGCTMGCDVALAAYIPQLYFINTSQIGGLFNIPNDQINNRISAYNPDYTGSDMNLNMIFAQGLSINVSFPCDCISGAFLGHNFSFLMFPKNDKNVFHVNFEEIATTRYSNLTTVEWLMETNPNVNPAQYDGYSTLNVVINCSCGDPTISMDYGFFLTYPLQQNDTLASLSQKYKVSEDLLQKYNPSVDFTAGEGIVFLPVKDITGSYRPFPYHMPAWKIADIVIGAAIAVAVVGSIIYWCTKNQKKILDFLGNLCGHAGMGNVQAELVNQHNNIYVGIDPNRSNK